MLVDVVVHTSPCCSSTHVVLLFLEEHVALLFLIVPCNTATLCTGNNVEQQNVVSQGTTQQVDVCTGNNEEQQVDVCTGNNEEQQVDVVYREQ